MNSSQLQQQIQSQLKELAEETDNVRKSEFFQKYLDTMSKFWQYSCSNQLLIHFALPEATKVAGFRAWKSANRNVKKGSKAIRILAPVIKDDEVVNFFPVSVFDISQTEGEPLPEIDINVDGDSAKQLLEKLVELCKARNISVEFKELGINGLYGYSKGGKIVVTSSDSINMKANTLIHEIAHELLHYGEGKSLSKEQKEIQAEGTAYVVAKHFGLETKSFNYLALYDADYKKIMDNLNAIAEASKEVIGFCC